MIRTFLFVFCFATLLLSQAEALAEPLTTVPTEEVTIVSVIDEALPNSEGYVSEVKRWEGQKIIATVSTEGDSGNLILKTKDGQPIGVFRSLATGGAADAIIQILDPMGFFDVPPVVRVQLKTPTGSIEGYLQKFTSPSLADLPIQKGPFTQEVQKVAILDMLIGNGDRNPGNLLALNGKLIPIDHNFSLVGPRENRVMPDQIQGDPWLLGRLIILRSNAVWFDPKFGFKRYIEGPWTDTSRSFIQKLNLLPVLERIHSVYGLENDSLLIIESLGLWLKKSTQIGLTPAQTASYVFGTGMRESRPFGRWKYGGDGGPRKFEDILNLMGFEEDFKAALIALSEQRPDIKQSDANYNDAYRRLFLSQFGPVLDRRYAVIKGDIDPKVRDQYLVDAWFRYFELKGARALAFNPEGKTRTGGDYEALKRIFKMSRELTLKWLKVEKGGIVDGFKDPDEVEIIYGHYASAQGSR